MGLELREPLRRAALARGRAQIEEAAAADGALRGGVAQHEAVAAPRPRSGVPARAARALRAPGAIGSSPSSTTRAADVGRRMMQPHRHPLRHRLRLGGEHAQRRVDAVGRRVQLRIEHHVAARDRVLGDAVAGEIERAALAGLRRARPARFCAWIERTRAGKPGRADGDAIADRDRARQHRAGDHRAGARQRERAIDREAEAAAARRARAASRARREQLLAQRVDAFAGHDRDRNDLGAGEPVAEQRVRDLGRRPRRAARPTRVGLGQRDDAARDAEQVDDREMLARLRHHAVVGRDHQQHEIDAGRARQHVVDEPLVARHVDEAEHRAVRRAADRRSRDRSRCRAPSLPSGGRYRRRSARAPARSCRGRYGPRCRRSWRGIGSESSLARLATNAVARLRGSAGRARAPVLDAADHRHGQRAQALRERVERAPALRCLSAGSRGRRSAALDRQRAASRSGSRSRLTSTVEGVAERAPRPPAASRVRQRVDLRRRRAPAAAASAAARRAGPDRGRAAASPRAPRASSCRRAARASSGSC